MPGRGRSIWVYDHFHTVPEPTMETTFECWTITATLARDTERVRIGQMVGCNGYRNPALYAKIASTVDVASNGRLDAGIGAGWYEHEWRAYGYGFPETPGADARLPRGGPDHPQDVDRRLNRPSPASTTQIDGPINEPKGVQTPHIPLWIGGGGEKVTLRLVARYGDACNVGGGNPEIVRQKLAILKEHCEAVGRNYDEIIRSTNLVCFVLAPGEDPEQATAAARRGMPFEEYAKGCFVAEPAAIQERIGQLQEAGITYLITYLSRLAYDHEQMHRFADGVIPAFR